MSPVEVTRTYLELVDPSQLRPMRLADADARFVKRAPCSVERYRALYGDVGGPWHWRDRLAWSDGELSAYLSQPEIVVWELEVAGESAGYFELRRQDDGAVEIVYFGLVPKFIGRGLGGAMLTRAVTEAWELGASRVWLHTCTLDSPRALPNYRARGFREYRSETYVADVESAAGT